MDEPSWWQDDEQLIAELGAAVRAGREVPDSFSRAGKDAFAWRTVDAELARLDADSALAEPESAGMRGTSADLPGRTRSRALSFVARELTIELEVGPDAVQGQLVPAQPGTVRVRDAGGAVLGFPVDEIGWFVIRPLPTGPFRLHVRTGTGASVLTDWIVT